MVISKMEGWEERESKEGKEKGKNKTNKQKTQTNKKQSQRNVQGDSVLINSKLDRH
jgi:hypothetical protein